MWYNAGVTINLFREREPELDPCKRLFRYQWERTERESEYYTHNGN